MQENYDLLIIGGGINGVAIAADAASRGLTTLLCEKEDLAAATSSASTKLIHGGLRYLELYDFSLVKNSLREREILLRKAPHLITPLEFVLPHEKHLRPAWMIRCALFLYDHLLLKKSLPNSRSLNLKKNPRGNALLPHFNRGFSYYDCATDDARLTIENAIAAAENGARILTRHAVIAATIENDYWKIKIKNTITQQIFFCHAKALINAAGPWINTVQTTLQAQKPLPIRLVKGSHIVVPQLFAGNFAYILQNTDTRIIFAIPYQNKFTLIGTTDVAFTGDLEQLKISSAEENYLCTVINQYFKQKISPQDIIWSYAGVRCLQQDAAESLAKISRDYQLVLITENKLPLLTIIGGKITTHRRVAEECIDQLKPFFRNLPASKTAKLPLPGGDYKKPNFSSFLQQFKQDFPWLQASLAERYAKNYGARAYFFLKNVTQYAELGDKIIADLYQKEVEYLLQYEWAQTADDILWRRSKLGLISTQEMRQQLENWLGSNNYLKAY